MHVLQPSARVFYAACCSSTSMNLCSTADKGISERIQACMYCKPSAHVLHRPLLQLHVNEPVQHCGLRHLTENLWMHVLQAICSYNLCRLLLLHAHEAAQ